MNRRVDWPISRPVPSCFGRPLPQRATSRVQDGQLPKCSQCTIREQCTAVHDSAVQIQRARQFDPDEAERMDFSLASADPIGSSRCARGESGAQLSRSVHLARASLPGTTGSPPCMVCKDGSGADGRRPAGARAPRLLLVAQASTVHFGRSHASRRCRRAVARPLVVDQNLPRLDVLEEGLDARFYSSIGFNKMHKIPHFSPTASAHNRLPLPRALTLPTQLCTLTSLGGDSGTTLALGALTTATCTACCNSGIRTLHSRRISSFMVAVLATGLQAFHFQQFPVRLTSSTIS